jgi:hypothetical protein
MILYSKNINVDWLQLFFLILILVLGVVGNILIILVYSRKNYKKYSSILWLQFLAMADGFAVFMTLPYIFSGFQINLFEYSSFTCKIFYFYQYFSPAVSSWFLFIVNIERYTSIKHRNKKVFSNKLFIAFVLVFIFVWNFFVYFPNFLFFKIKLMNVTENASDENAQQSFCEQNNPYTINVLPYVDLLNSTLIPFLIMLICTILIIRLIVRQRKKLNKNRNEVKRYKRDVQFSITIFLMNIFYFLLNMPFCIFNLLNSFEINFWFILIIIIYNLQFIFQFFVSVLLNRNFRRELSNLFHAIFCSRCTK